MQNLREVAEKEAISMEYNYEGVVYEICMLYNKLENQKQGGEGEGEGDMVAAQCQEDGGEVRDPWLRPTLTLIFLPYFRLPQVAKVFQMPFPAGIAIVRSPPSTN